MAKSGKLASIFRKAVQASRDIAHDPATAIAAGSVFMAAANGGVEGAYLNLAAAFGIACLRGYESWTGREQGLPFGALALVNFGTAASVGGHALYDHGLSAGIAQKLLITGTYFFSGIRSALLAWQKRESSRPRHFGNDPQFYQGLACLGATRLDHLPTLLSGNRQDLIPVALSALGITRTFLKDKENDKPQSFLRRHYTAARMYAAQYGVSTISNLLSSDFTRAAGFALWSWGLSRFDRGLNRELAEKTKNALGHHLT